MSNGKLNNSEITRAIKDAMYKINSVDCSARMFEPFTYKLDLNDALAQTAIYTDLFKDDIKEDIKEESDEWIWITGYKGTDKDMKCMNDYQYELGKQFNMPEGEPIVDCHSGFHLCKNLNDVFGHYRIGYGRRYFEVTALVRKKDVEAYDTGPFKRRDKLAAKSIVFTRELSIDEILEDTDAAEWSSEFKQMAIEQSIQIAKTAVLAKHLTELGYSAAFSEYIADEGDDAYEAAVRVASQKELSMDMKVLAIMKVI